MSSINCKTQVTRNAYLIRQNTPFPDGSNSSYCLVWAEIHSPHPSFGPNVALQPWVETNRSPPWQLFKYLNTDIADFWFKLKLPFNLHIRWQVNNNRVFWSWSIKCYNFDFSQNSPLYSLQQKYPRRCLKSSDCF